MDYPEPFKSQWDDIQKMTDYKAHYPFSLDNVKEFINFCRASGGFEICQTFHFFLQSVCCIQHSLYSFYILQTKARSRSRIGIYSLYCFLQLAPCGIARVGNAVLVHASRLSILDVRVQERLKKTPADFFNFFTEKKNAIN